MSTGPSSSTKTALRSRSSLEHPSPSCFSQLGHSGVAGHIQCDRLTVSGGLLSVCSDRFRKGSICLHRDSGSDNVITVLYSEHCKWCKTGCVSGQQDNFGGDLYTGKYLQAVFRVKVSEAARLTELITELTYTQGRPADLRELPVTGTPPYCTVANVKHISSAALATLQAFDEDFVWGDNLTFNTKANNI